MGRFSSLFKRRRPRSQLPVSRASRDASLERTPDHPGSTPSSPVVSNEFPYDPKQRGRPPSCDYRIGSPERRTNRSPMRRSFNWSMDVISQDETFQSGLLSYSHCKHNQAAAHKPELRLKRQEAYDRIRGQGRELETQARRQNPPSSYIAPNTKPPGSQNLGQLPRSQTVSLTSLPEEVCNRRSSLSSAGSWTSLHSARSGRWGKKTKNWRAIEAEKKWLFGLWNRSTNSIASRASNRSKVSVSFSSQASEGDPIQETLDAMEGQLRGAEKAINLTAEQKRWGGQLSVETFLQNTSYDQAFFAAVFRLRCFINAITLNFGIYQHHVHTAPFELICIGDDVRQCCVIPTRSNLAGEEYASRARKLMAAKFMLEAWYKEFQKDNIASTYGPNVMDT